MPISATIIQSSMVIRLLYDIILYW
jgi:hypothetical protein